MATPVDESSLVEWDAVNKKTLLLQNELEEEVRSLKSSISHKEQLEHQLDNRAKTSSQNISQAIPSIRWVVVQISGQH